jgi:hypothetical protein
MRFAGSEIDLTRFCVGAYGIYALYFTGHFLATHLYVTYCTPLTVMGFLQTAILVPAPHCNLLRGVIYHFGDGISQIWSSLTAVVFSLMVSIK